MDDKLKGLLQEFGSAINDSLSDSDRIAEAIEAMKRAGYSVFLVLEATIGYNRRQEDEDPETGPKADEETTATGTGVKVRWTSQDAKFLKALKISTDEEGT